MNSLDMAFADNELSLLTSMVNLLIGLILGLALKFHFEKFSSTLSGKKELSRILPFMILIVCLIITIVKSSLALSLGLVGALSIVRFRTPIKEPEELAYLFMAIAIGLGLGANKTLFVIIASIAIMLAMSLLRWKHYSHDTKVIYLHIEAENTNELEINEKSLSQMIASRVNAIDLKRFERHKDNSQISYIIDIDSPDIVFELVEEIQNKYSTLKISIIDQSRIPGV